MKSVAFLHKKEGLYLHTPVAIVLELNFEPINLQISGIIELFKGTSSNGWAMVARFERKGEAKNRKTHPYWNHKSTWY